LQPSFQLPALGPGQVGKPIVDTDVLDHFVFAVLFDDAIEATWSITRRPKCSIAGRKSICSALPDARAMASTSCSEQ
jgi:hypothetical protein